MWRRRGIEVRVKMDLMEVVRVRTMLIDVGRVKTNLTKAGRVCEIVYLSCHMPTRLNHGDKAVRAKANVTEAGRRRT